MGSPAPCLKGDRIQLSHAYVSAECGLNTAAPFAAFAYPAASRIRHWVEIAESLCQVLHLIRFPKVVWPVEMAWKPGLYTLPINTRTNTMSRTMPRPPLG